MATKTESPATYEYPKGSHIKIRIVDNASNGQKFGISYQVVVPVKVTGRKRIRKQFPAKQDAERFAAKQHKGYQKNGQAFFKLTDGERQEIGLMVPRLREKGISITEAIEYAIARLRPAGGELLLSDVVDELQASKQKRYDAGDLADHSLKDFETRSNRLKKDLGQWFTHEIEAEQIKAWGERIEGSNRTRMNYLRIASEVFRYAHQKKYITHNPIDDLGDNDRKEIHGRLEHGGDIEILTVKQAEDFLHFTLKDSPEFLAIVSLGLFCGIRTEELSKLDWEKVSLEGGTVTIDSSIAKKRRIRHVMMPDNCKEWLMLCSLRTGSVIPYKGKEFQNRFSGLRKRAGFVDDKEHSTWPRNAMRHSFGSYHYALHGDSSKTSKELGHKAGDDVLFDHYRALATQEQGQKYFSVCPGELRSGVVKMDRRLA